jgi:hypothetical protein
MNRRSLSDWGAWLRSKLRREPSFVFDAAWVDEPTGSVFTFFSGYFHLWARARGYHSDEMVLLIASEFEGTELDTSPPLECGEVVCGGRIDVRHFLEAPAELIDRVGVPSFYDAFCSMGCWGDLGSPSPALGLELEARPWEHVPEVFAQFDGLMDSVR